MKAFAWHISLGGFWFRIFGYGLNFRDRRRHAPLFSEREGLRRVFKLPRGWIVMPLWRRP